MTSCDHRSGVPSIFLYGTSELAQICRHRDFCSDWRTGAGVVCGAVDVESEGACLKGQGTGDVGSDEKG